MQEPVDHEQTIEYESRAPAAPKNRLPSPWLIPTLVGNPFFWLVASIAITLLAIAIRIFVRTV